MLGQLRLIKGTGRLILQVIGAAIDQAFLPEDFRRNQWQGKLYPSLVERLALTVGKEAEANEDAGLCSMALDLVELAIRDCHLGDPKWLLYRKGMLQGRLGRTREAIETLVPFVRRSQGEYWAWQALGDLYESEDAETSLTLFAKAWLECGRPEFRLKVEQAIGRTASQVGDTSLAKWAVDQAVTTRKKRGYSLPPSLVGLVEQPWFQSVTPDPTPQRTLERLAEGAGAFLSSDATWVEACVVEAFKSKSGREMVRLALRCGGRTIGAVASRPNERVGTLVRGQRARVLATFENGGATIHRIEGLAETGHDLLDGVVGVVKHHRPEKGFTSLYLPGDKFTVIYHSAFPEVGAFELGTPLSLWTISDRGRTKVVAFDRATVPDTEWILSVTGRVSKRNEGYGFLGDTYVPRDIAASLNPDEKVTLIAVKTLDKKKGQMSFKAIGLLPEPEPEAESAGQANVSLSSKR